MKYAAIILTLGLLAGCSGGDDFAEESPFNEELQIDYSNYSQEIVGELGEPYDLSDGQTLTVIAIEMHPDAIEAAGLERTHVVTVRVDNTTDELLLAAEGLIHCDGSDKDGPWCVDSTYNQYGDVPAGGFIQGDLILGMPIGETDCLSPVVQFEADNFVTVEGQPRTIVQYPVELP